MDDEARSRFGLYVHWPFCAAKCPYCDFNSHVRHTAPDQARFARAYRREIETMAARLPGRTVSSVFFGGGTPSLMDGATVGAILDAVAEFWTLAPDAEITLEANPSSVEAGRFADYRAAGVNRLSLGVQALDDPALKALGRLHDVKQARDALNLAVSRFPRVSFDLIYARPGQDLESWRAELTEALELGAEHLSLYQLTVEPGTPFFDLWEKGRLHVPEPDQAASFYELTQELCNAYGLPAYEVSNHARAGCESRHNLVYWRYGEYAGIGPGAHGRLAVDGARRATEAHRHPETWLEQVESRGSGIRLEEPLSKEEMGDEFLLMGLRLREGVDLNAYEAISGRRLDPARQADLTDHGMIEPLGNARVRVTPAGWLVLNAVVADLAA